MTRTKTLNFEIGGYSNLMQATQEAREFSSSAVFSRRSGMFPNPQSFQLEITSIGATAKQWPDAPNPLNQFYVELILRVKGDEEKMADWEKRVRSAIRIFHPSNSRHPGEMGERAEHLKFRAQQKAKDEA